MIDVQNISKSFGKLKVLDDINITFPSDAFIGIVGPNGSGKTTLIKCILGLIRPDEGAIYYQGKSVNKAWAYRKDVCYLPQVAQFPSNLKVSELLELLKDLRKDYDREEELTNILGINEFVDKKFNALSGGMKQKVNILVTLMYSGHTIILDEPTTGLDPMSQLKLKNFLLEEKAAGKCILITTHILSLLDEMCDKILFLLDGKVHYYDSILKLKEQTAAPTVEKAIPSLLGSI